ncbi:MAG: flavodoxin family protein [Eubacteriaceae bacterium]|jgi:Multimeric flavodoxin WrbA|nr:flavodoxin family protein [Eubacteriaceae bacterium]
MSKVILLSGSPNENGNTVQLLKECAGVIEKNGVEAEVVSLAGMHLRDVMDLQEGCEDGFDEIISKIKEAQGFIAGGPVYWGTVRAELMTALQRIAMASMQQGNFLSRKAGGPIAVARRGGVTSAIQEMMMFFLSNDMIVPGSTYWNIAFGQKPGDVINDAEGLETIKRFGENMAFVVEAING